jgi:Protein of unknown function (DUF2851)
VRESPLSAHIYEHELARRWYALPVGVHLPLSDGETCQLLFTGRPGSSAGPDIHDAIVLFSRQETQSLGDVELHIRANDWFVHQHHSDARYNNVMLHVVLTCDNTSPITRQDGMHIPMCSLYDLPPPSSSPRVVSSWPCHAVMPYLGDEERAYLLRQAGLLRFEQKAHKFVESLHQSTTHSNFSSYDVCLLIALAEGLGYGRDRVLFRATGQYLLGLTTSIPEPLGRSADPSPLDVKRLSILHWLIEQWRQTSAWETLREAMFQTTSTPSPDASIQALRTIFSGLGTARADILICNIVLPFALAVALIEDDSRLAAQAQLLYTRHPGLSSNRITRAMCQQLQLATAPRGACQQQGLHYIYQQTCQEKRCDLCVVGKRLL